MTRKDLTNPSREGRSYVRSILHTYVQGMINDGDYERLERELLDVVRAERGLVLHIPRKSSRKGSPHEPA